MSLNYCGLTHEDRLKGFTCHSPKCGACRDAMLRSHKKKTEIEQPLLKRIKELESKCEQLEKELMEAQELESKCEQLEKLARKILRVSIMDINYELDFENQLRELAGGVVKPLYRLDQ